MMKTAFFFLSFFAIAQLSAQSRKLVWQDEFDYSGLPDSTKWDYERGHVRNMEQQYYTSGKPMNSLVHDGFLEIKGIRENVVNVAFKAGSSNWQTRDSLASYSSASIISHQKASWKYGRIEVRAKIPNGAGIWPAIWMLGENIDQNPWPGCGEIDIMEYVGSDTSHIYGTVHYQAPLFKKHRSSGNKIQLKRPFDGFHVYAADWDENGIRFYVDGNNYHDFKIKKASMGKDNPFRKPFYLLINLALGGSWPGPVDDAILPQSFLIDYVRVYQ